MNNEEIINALKMIKEICKAHFCNNCPFAFNKFNNDMLTLCSLREIDPCDWDINEEKQIWRAFK